MNKFFRKIDLFAVPISFRYNKEESYSTFIGGFFTFIIFISGASCGIYYFIPFITKKNFSLYFNTINLSETETITLEEINNALAIGLECDTDQNGTNIEKYLEQYLDIKIKYYNKQKNEDGKYNKRDPDNNTYNICNYTDFYNKHYESGYNIKNKTLKYLNDLNKEIQGRYGDTYFKYIEISLLSKIDISNESFKKIDNALINNDCKLELHFTDNKMNFSKYRQPITPFINEICVQLNPEYTVKMNVFFMNQHFDNDYDLFFTIKNTKKIKNLFSRTEQYYLYKGLNRGELRPTNYQYYAKIYIRADTKRIEVKRKYQNFFEYYSDTFSFWVAVFYVFDFLIFNGYNNFQANYSIEKRLFFFKNAKNENFNIYDNQNQIKNLIEKIKKKTNEKQNENNNKKTKSHNKIIDNEINVINFNSLSQNKNLNKNDSHLNFINSKIQRNKIEYLNSETSLTKNDNLINYSFNIFEYLIIRISRQYLKFCQCFKFLCKTLKFKAILSSKAANIIHSKLDIIFYIKNMMFLEKYQTLIHHNKSGIYKFVCMPIISTNEKEIKKMNLKRILKNISLFAKKI